MTATDELRRMLDERGVEYEQADGWWTSWETEGVYSYGGVVYCEDLGSGLEIRWHTITPGQAIAATLGVETCRWEYPQGVNGWVGYTVCSSCGERFDECVTDTAHYCPNCGAKVVDE